MDKIRELIEDWKETKKLLKDTIKNFNEMTENVSELTSSINDKLNKVDTTIKDKCADIVDYIQNIELSLPTSFLAKIVVGVGIISFLVGLAFGAILG